MKEPKEYLERTLSEIKTVDYRYQWMDASKNLRCHSSLTKLEEWLDQNGWAGFDPYDALNTKLLNILSFNRRALKIAYTQGLKRIPWNIRKLLGTKVGINPKGMGILASAYLRLFQLTGNDNFSDKAKFCLDWLKNNHVDGYAGYCWGYNFDSQSRGCFLPKGTPTIVNTSFIANAFLDAYQLYNNQEFLDIARSSCEFILKDLNKVDDGEFICFSYTPIDQTQVYNASLLGAFLLARVYCYTKESRLLDLANQAVNFVVTHQNADGSWYYGNAPFYKWIDGYHTGFVIEALYDYINFSGNSEFLPPLIRGINFYKENLFTPNNIPKFHHDSIYPIDIHCCAQGIITFAKLRDVQSDNMKFANEVAEWTIKNMQSRNGYFYFQKHRFFTNKIPYIRWGQAWMLKALSTLLSVESKHE